MSALSICHWDFNRVPADSNPDFLTASIAIFQWRPKASGNGLKKVNACRVCGYMLSRHDMYVKAQEICDRLNAEGASALSPPQWLQKTYSVPKPTALVIPRLSPDLPRSVVRTIRQRVMKGILLPAGFVKAREGATYVRQFGDQIHVIYFQGMGGGYVVELGIHYAFLPPLFAGRKIDLTDYSLLDCGLRARTSAFAKTKPERYFEYGTDRQRLERTLAQNASECLRILDLATKRFADPAQLLRRAACELNRQVIRPWLALNDDFAPLVALHLGRRHAAIAKVEKMLANADGGWVIRYRKLLAWMKKTSGKLSSGRGFR